MTILRLLTSACLFAVIIAGLDASDASQAQAQTVISVPFNSAVFAWDATPADATHSAATKHTVVCGAVQVDVPMPATSIPIRNVIPGPGVYSCSLFASNTFGRQTEPNVPFPQFEAGTTPWPPTNTRLEVSDAR